MKKIFLITLFTILTTVPLQNFTKLFSEKEIHSISRTTEPGTDYGDLSSDFFYENIFCL